MSLVMTESSSNVSKGCWGGWVFTDDMPTLLNVLQTMGIPESGTSQTVGFDFCDGDDSLIVGIDVIDSLNTVLALVFDHVVVSKELSKERDHDAACVIFKQYQESLNEKSKLINKEDEHDSN